MFLETPVTQMHCVSPAHSSAQFVTNWEIRACLTHMLLLLHITSLANEHIEIKTGWTNGDWSCVTVGVNSQIVIFDDVSLGKAMRVHILLCVSFCLILETKLWAMIILLCIWKDRMGHTIVPDSKPLWLTTNELDIVLCFTVTSES